MRENIKAADAKRATETATKYYHKWSEILRTLEVKLDKAKIRLTSIDAEIEEKTQRLRELEQKAVAEAAQRAKRIEEIKDLPPEQFANLSMEDMELLQEIELAEGTAVEPGQSGLGSYDPAEAAGLEAVVGLEPAETDPQTDRIRLAVVKAVLKANSEYERVRAKAAESVRADRARPGGDEAQATA